MGVYFAAFASSIILYLLLNKGKLCNLADPDKRQVYFPLIIASIPPLAVAALRYNVGTDYFPTYYTGFYRILAGINFDQFEIGYWLINKLVQLFTDNVFVMFAVAAILFVGFSYAAIGKSSDNVVLSILLFMLTRYYFIGLNVVRQFIALAIISYAMHYVIKRDLRKFLIFACLAVSFHISTLVLIPIYWLVDVKIKPKTVALCCLFLLIGGNSVLAVISTLLPEGSKYGLILSGYSTTGLLFTIGTISINVFLLLIFYSNYNLRNQKRKYCCFLWLQIIATMVTMLLPVVPAIERMYWTFSFFSFISLPYMLAGIHTQALKFFATLLLVCGLGFYMYYDIAILKDHEVVPYESIIGHTAIPSTEFDFRSTHRLDRGI